MMTEPTQRYTDEELQGDAISKKDLVSTLQELASFKFLVEHKLKGAVKNVIKTKTKEQLVQDYTDLFESKAFKKEGEEEEVEEAALDKKKKDISNVTKATQKMKIKEEIVGSEAPKFTKRTITKGNNRYPSKGMTVACLYTGKLEDGTVFDTNIVARKGKKSQPLKFKVGIGQVIKGWDEGLLTMSIGEKAELRIEPEWAYGKKGLEGKIPPHSVLIFEVELISAEG